MLPHADSEQPLQAEPHRGTAPRVAAVGGGTGLPNVLRGLRPVLFADAAAPRERLVAIVATSDDGLDFLTRDLAPFVRLAETRWPRFLQPEDPVSV